MLPSSLKRFCILVLVTTIVLPPSGWAEDGDLLPEIELICAKTPEAMAYSREELQILLAECDRLKLRVESLPETQRKVYRKRLEMARNLFHFVLGEKEQAPPP